MPVFAFITSMLLIRHQGKLFLIFGIFADQKLFLKFFFYGNTAADFLGRPLMG